MVACVGHIRLDAQSGFHPGTLRRRRIKLALRALPLLASAARCPAASCYRRPPGFFFRADPGPFAESRQHAGVDPHGVPATAGLVQGGQRDQAAPPARANTQARCVLHLRGPMLAGARTLPSSGAMEPLESTKIAAAALTQTAALPSARAPAPRYSPRTSITRSRRCLAHHARGPFLPSGPPRGALGLSRHGLAPRLPGCECQHYFHHCG